MTCSDNLFAHAKPWLSQACEDLGLPSNGSKEANIFRDATEMCLMPTKPLRMRPGIDESPYIRDRSSRNLSPFVSWNGEDDASWPAEATTTLHR